MKKIVIPVLILIVIALCYYAFIRTPSKQVYVATGSLYESYKGTKELQTKVVNQQNRYKLVLDSLRLEINLYESDALSKQKILKAEELKKQYNVFATDFQKYNEEYVQAEQAKLWTQLNQYIEAYGKENNYSYIYGADGSGNIMYADSSLNITKQVIEFANMKYDGK